MRLRRRPRFDLAAYLLDHQAALAECDARLRLARELHAEMARWPSPLRCWQLLQQGCPNPVPARPDLVRRLATIDLRARGLPLMVDR